MRVLEVRMELSNRVVDGIVQQRCCEINTRLAKWQERWDEVSDALDAIVAERGAELGDECAGGSTGFIAKDYKGKEADVPVYRVDPAMSTLLHDLLDIGERVARELGQWTDRKDIHIYAHAPKPDLERLTEEERDIVLTLLKKAVPPQIEAEEHP